jgi:hypothetical protein
MRTDLRKEVEKRKNQELIEEMEEITKRRESLLYIVDKVAEYSLEIKEWISKDPTQDYRPIHSANLTKC